MIITHLIGGLGNQMFQYAVGRHIAQRNNATLKLDINNLIIHQGEGTQRKYNLHVFNIREKFATQDEIMSLIQRRESFFSKIKDKIRKIDRSYYDQPFIKERHFHFDPEVLKIKDNKYIQGYWQSEKYFIDIEDIIRKDFTLKIDASPVNKELMEKINQTEAISIHLRRGDYVMNKEINKFHGICSLDYYYSTVKLINQKISKPHFFVFSDDLVWVKDNLKIEYPSTFIDHNGIDKAYEDMRLLSLCKHHIIANSSFSWWGAWLCRNPNKIVIAPSKWFNDESINTKDLIPDGWIKI